MSDEIWETIDAPNNGNIIEIANDNNTDQLDLYFYRHSMDDIQETQSEPDENPDTIVDEFMSPEPVSYPSGRRRSRSVGSRSHFYDLMLHANYELTNSAPIAAVPDTSVASNSICSSTDQVDFVNSLRSEMSHDRKQPRITRPRPFNLSQPKHNQKLAAVKPSPPLAEAVERWSNAVPDRYHTLPKNQKPQPVVQNPQAAAQRTTSAKTPPLASMGRRRPRQYPGREVLEEQELEAIRKNGFKAHSVPKGVLTPPETKEHKRVLPVTVPKTPKFSEAGIASLRAARHRNISASTSVSNDSSSSASSATGEGKPRLTKICPFSFEQRDKKMLQAKQMKIDKIIEEERKQAEFHANPLPAFLHQTHAKQPQQVHVSQQSTQVVPFRLAAETRMAEVAQKRMEKLEDERRKENEAKQFKAKPPTVLYREPFKPLPLEEKQLTQAIGFDLASEERAAKRKEFEQFLKQREEDIEKARKEREERKRKEEEKEAARLRRLAEFKAQPIHHYKPVEERPKLEVTVPVTPKFLKKSAEN